MASPLSSIKTLQQIYNQDVVKIRTEDITLVPAALMAIGIIVIIGSIVAAGFVWPHVRNASIISGAGISFGGSHLVVGLWKDRKIEAKLDEARSFFGRRLDLMGLATTSSYAREIFYWHTYLMLHETRKIPLGYLWKAEKDGEKLYMLGTCHIKLIKTGEENDVVIHPYIQSLLSTATDLYLEIDTTPQEAFEVYNEFRSEPVPGFGNIFKEVDGLDRDLAVLAKKKNIKVHTVELETLQKLEEQHKDIKKREQELEARRKELEDKHKIRLPKTNMTPIRPAAKKAKTVMFDDELFSVDLHNKFVAIDRKWNQKLFESRQEKTFYATDKENIERNKKFVEVILSNFKKPGIKPLYAFGAAHFEEANGILPLLEQHGFAVTRITLH